MIIDWNSSALWGIIGVIAGILVSSFFYFIGQKRKTIIYDITTVALISNKTSKLKDLSIKYKNKPINNLHISTIKIKNNGNSIIEPKDFAPSFPLTIATTGEFFVDLNDDAEITTPLFSENNFNKVFFQIIPTEDEEFKKIAIQFDYIPKKSTIICEVFHTGSLSINGRLKEGKIINNKTLGKTFLLTSFNDIITVAVNNVIEYEINRFRDMIEKHK